MQIYKFIEKDSRQALKKRKIFEKKQNGKFDIAGKLSIFGFIIGAAWAALALGHP